MRSSFLFLSISGILLLAMLLLAMPAGATLVLSGTTLSPPGLPLVTSQELSVDARISIIPSGAKTFSSGHNLQMETDLADARWSTVVFVDGIPADREGGTGGVVFISGFVLSYPTYRDVALEVTVEGTVPGEVAPEITVLRIRELDNGGAPVPGSAVLVTGQVSTPPTVPGTDTIPEVTTPFLPPTPSPQPTRAGGFTFLAGLIAAGSLVTARSLYRRRGGPL
jgi:hypothetical protein